MKRKMFLAVMVVLTLIVFVPCAWSAGVLKMPPNPVIVDDYNSWGAATIMGGMFDITISGIIDDWKYDVQNDTYRGWCMENNHSYPGIKDKQYDLYDSTDTANLPSVFIGKPWDKVNYLMNHKQGTRYDVQKALWRILGTDAYSLVVDPQMNETAVNEMVAAANNNGLGFIPGPGQFVAVLILNDGFVGTGERNQDTLIEVQLPAGCTFTPGYWKTHSKYAGSKKYDSTWAKIQPNGEDTTFYLSSQTWYQVLWTPPKKGNVYYILSFQFIAAKLNIAAGASSTPEVDAALFLADKFFMKYTPAQALTLKDKEKKLYIGLANILDSYNNGYIGPGHCSDSCLR